MIDYYKALRISSGASQSLIIEAYQSLKKKIFDENGLMALEEAYLVLGNPEKRAEYDEIYKGAQAKILKVDLDQEQKKQYQIQQYTSNQKKEFQEYIDQGKSTFGELIFPYIGHNIAINIVKPNKLVAARVLSVGKEFFTVNWQGMSAHIPYNQILRVFEASQGEMISTVPIIGVKAKLVVSLFDLVIYSGFIGFSVEF